MVVLWLSVTVVLKDALDPSGFVALRQLRNLLLLIDFSRCSFGTGGALNELGGVGKIGADFNINFVQTIIGLVEV